MSEALHTPGPWQVNTSPDLSDLTIVAKIRGDGWGSSVAIRSQRNRVKPLNRDEADANAHLISAAPDLLAALEKFIGYHVKRNVGDHHLEKFAIPEALAAIARATGKGE